MGKFTASTGTRKRALLLGNQFGMTYRVLRCASDAGLELFAVGGTAAQALRYSRHCAGAYFTDAIDGCFNPSLASQVNEICEELRVDVLLPGDAPGTRSLIANASLLSSPTFPLPSLRQFDDLNNKWMFSNLCTSLDVLQPKTELFGDAQELAGAIIEGTIALPVVAKPLAMSGSTGCIVIDELCTTRKLSLVDYSPILVQTFVQGADVGASVFCSDGVVLAFLAHNYDKHVYTMYPDQEIQRDVARIVAATGATGVLNFDMRRAPDGKHYFLECNPRFYFKMALSALAGLNLIRIGLDQRAQSQIASPTKEVKVYMPESLAHTWSWLGDGSKSWLKGIGFVAGDPLPWFLQKLGMVRPAPIQNLHQPERRKAYNREAQNFPLAPAHS